MLLEFKHSASQRAIIREMDITELETMLKAVTDPELIKYIQTQISQISGKKNKLKMED